MSDETRVPDFDFGGALAQRLEAAATQFPEWDRWLPLYSWNGFGILQGGRPSARCHRRLRRAVRTVYAHRGPMRIWLTDVDPWRDGSGLLPELVVTSPEDVGSLESVERVLKAWLSPDNSLDDALKQLGAELGYAVPRASVTFLNRDSYYFKCQYESSKQLWEDAISPILAADQGWRPSPPNVRLDGVPMQPEGGGIAEWYSDQLGKGLSVTQFAPEDPEWSLHAWVEDLNVATADKRRPHLVIRCTLCAESIDKVKSLLGTWVRKEVTAEEMNRLTQETV